MASTHDDEGPRLYSRSKTFPLDLMPRQDQPTATDFFPRDAAVPSLQRHEDRGKQASPSPPSRAAGAVADCAMTDARDQSQHQRPNIRISVAIFEQWNSQYLGVPSHSTYSAGDRTPALESPMTSTFALSIGGDGTPTTESPQTPNLGSPMIPPTIISAKDEMATEGTPRVPRDDLDELSPTSSTGSEAGCLDRWPPETII